MSVFGSLIAVASDSLSRQASESETPKSTTMHVPYASSTCNEYNWSAANAVFTLIPIITTYVLSRKDRMRFWKRRGSGVFHLYSHFSRQSGSGGGFSTVGYRTDLFVQRVLRCSPLELQCQEVMKILMASQDIESHSPKGSGSLMRLEDMTATLYLATGCFILS